MKGQEQKEPLPKLGNPTYSKQCYKAQMIGITKGHYFQEFVYFKLFTCKLYQN